MTTDKFTEKINALKEEIENIQKEQETEERKQRVTKMKEYRDMFLGKCYLFTYADAWQECGKIVAIKSYYPDSNGDTISASVNYVACGLGSCNLEIEFEETREFSVKQLSDNIVNEKVYHDKIDEVVNLLKNYKNLD